MAEVTREDMLENLFKRASQTLRRATMTPLGQLVIGPTDARDLVAQIVQIETGQQNVTYHQADAILDSRPVEYPK